MASKITAPQILKLKASGQRIVCVTAYDTAFGELADSSGVDLILVGDSLGNVVLGHSTTVPVNLEDMIQHTKAVRSGVSKALLIADLPFGSYQSSVEKAVDSAVALMKAGAEGVKLEGDYPECVRAIVKAGIPVMGHLGMTPQSVFSFGGPRVQGKGEAGDEIIAIADRISEAGAFGIVLELVPANLAKRITESSPCATIGIGAGPFCDGQIQVLNDVLGLSAQTFKHAKAYMNGNELVKEALKAYAEEVRGSAFPAEEHSF